MKKLLRLLAPVLLIIATIFTLSSCDDDKNSDDTSEICQHQWVEADCLYPKTCRLCYKTEGEALGHNFSNATCTEPQICKNCNLKKGTPLGHDWGTPTCTTSRTCCVCFAVDPNSEPLGHNYYQGECMTCGEDDPDYIELTLTSTTYSINLEDDCYVAYITMTGGESVTCDIEDTVIVNCEWGEWDGDTIPLIFYPISNGQTSVTIFIDNTDVKIEIDVIVESNQSYKIQRMSALGIDAAYNSAKFPSTLHMSRVTYEDIVNGYGDSITRMVIECYATNSFGGYSYIYIVVLCCEYETNYLDLEWDDLYFSINAYNSNPGMCDYTLDNKTAMNAYRNLINNPKDIPYD